MNGTRRTPQDTVDRDRIQLQAHLIRDKLFSLRVELEQLHELAGSTEESQEAFDQVEADLRRVVRSIETLIRQMRTS
jgi:hypothetical protein